MTPRTKILASFFFLALAAGAAFFFLRLSDTQTAMAAEPLSQEKLDAALSERSIGDPKAPITLYEHSSLSCPHCGHFHQETLPKLKANYVDTGKVRIVFRDFPLNAPALAGSVLARCLPESRYFDYASLLFETQPQWLGKEDFEKTLRQNAALAGLSPAEADACLSSDALKKGIVEKMQEDGKRLGIDSTPTFTIGDKPDSQKIIGAAPYEEFAAALDKALAEAKK